LASVKSDYTFAHDWAQQRERKKEPLKLQTDIQKLLELLTKRNSTEQLKEHIITSKCFSVEEWLRSECGSEHFDEPGPLGLSHGDVVDKCLSYYDFDFAGWLCIRLNLHDACKRIFFWKEERWRTTKLRQNELLLFAKENDKDKLVNILSRQFKHEPTSSSTHMKKSYIRWRLQ